MKKEKKERTGEHWCHISNQLCLRPGEPLPGAKAFSHTGYCGGRTIEEGVCPEILKYARTNYFLSLRGPIKNPVLERTHLRDVMIHDGDDKFKSIIVIITNGLTNIQ